MISTSIIIPAWNEGSTLKGTLKALSQIDYDKKKCEVLIVAGGEDRTYEIAQRLSMFMGGFSRYLVIQQEPKGKNAAIQRGMQQASSELLVFLDADTMVSGQWLQSMVGPIERGECHLTIANPEPVRRNWVSDFYMITKMYFIDRITTFSGHSIAVKLDFVRTRIEYFFDEDVKVGVDYLLAKRVMEQGGKIRFVEAAHVVTHIPSSLRYFMLSELRWLTGLIRIEGVRYRAFAANTALTVAAVLMTVPWSEESFVMALVFNGIYIGKRMHMFLVGSRKYSTAKKNAFGFILLSYLHHVIGFIAHLRHFLGFSKQGHLSQGQRY